MNITTSKKTWSYLETSQRPSTFYVAMLMLNPVGNGTRMDLSDCLN